MAIAMVIVSGKTAVLLIFICVSFFRYEILCYMLTWNLLSNKDCENKFYALSFIVGELDAGSNKKRWTLN
jgi:hypothetical protein